MSEKSAKDSGQPGVPHTASGGSSPAPTSISSGLLGKLKKAKPITLDAYYILDESPWTITQVSWPIWDERMGAKEIQMGKKYDVIMVEGDQIRPGDHIETQHVTKAGGSVARWGVEVVRTSKGLGWKYPGENLVTTEVDDRFKPGNWFKVRRPRPETNEFGEVTP